MKIKMTMRCAAVAAVLLLAACAGGGANPSIAKEGAPAPQWSLKSNYGIVLSQANLKGQAVYLNFFATWCPPCNAEAPGIETLYKKYAKQGLMVVGVDEQETAAKAALFRKEHNLTYPTVVDNTSVLRDAYAVNGLPVHVFIGRDGVVKKIVTGEMDQPAIEAAIKTILTPTS